MNRRPAAVAGLRATQIVIAALVVGAGALLVASPVREAAPLRLTGGPPSPPATSDRGADLLDVRPTAAAFWTARRPNHR